MSKAVIIIATILISVVLVSQANGDHKQRRHQHTSSVSQVHSRQHLDHSKHHGYALGKEKHNHGHVPAAIPPHHSRSHSGSRRHKSSGSSKVPKTRHHQEHKKSVHKPVRRH